MYVSCIWGEYSRRFRLFYLRVCEEKWQRQSPGRERTLFILLILEKHIISLLLWLYRNKVDPLQIQMIPYSYLYDQNWQSIFSSFHEHKEIRDSPHRCGLRPQGKPIRDRVGRVHSCHCQQGKKTLQVTWHNDSQIRRRPSPPPLPNFFFFFTDLHNSREWPISRWKRWISPKGDKFAPLYIYLYILYISSIDRIHF